MYVILVIVIINRYSLKYSRWKRRKRSA